VPKLIECANNSYIDPDYVQADQDLCLQSAIIQEANMKEPDQTQVLCSGCMMFAEGINQDTKDNGLSMSIVID